MQMVQVEFERHDNSTVYNIVVWVDIAWNLKTGDEVFFKGQTLKWRVTKVYTTVAEYAELGRKWGLDLPKSQRTER